MSQPEKYTCKDAFEKLDDFLDRELSETEIELVKEHLERCKDCAGAYKFEGDMLECVRQKIKHIALPEDLLSKINAALDESENR